MSGMREKKDNNIQIGEQVKLARERSKMTQERLAERIEVSPQYVSDLERGVVGVSVATLKRICDVLRVSADQLLFGAASGNAFLPILEKCSLLSDTQQTLLCDIMEAYLKAVLPPKER